MLNHALELDPYNEALNQYAVRYLGDLGAPAPSTTPISTVGGRASSGVARTKRRREHSHSLEPLARYRRFGAGRPR